MNEVPCADCVRPDLRITEEYELIDSATARITDLAGKGTLAFACARGPRIQVCYRGVHGSAGVLPRYEGELIDGP